MTTTEQHLPTIKNRYCLVEELGQGGMGIVYSAIDRLTQQWVALKRLLVPLEYLEFLSLATSQNLLLSLANEFQVVASLRHPHIIRVFDYGFDIDKQPYLVMELLEESQFLTIFGRAQPSAHSVTLLVDTLRALEYLHRRGIIHRDLKPGNLLIQNSQVKVVDFGLCVKRGQLTDVEGTIPYVAPEVLAGQPVSEASDLYAIGVIAYEMFVGRLPFFHGDVKEMMRMIREDAPKVDLPEIPEKLRHILARLLSKQAEQRYDSASVVIRELSKEHRIVIEESPLLRESFLQAAAFIGRDDELNQLTQALQRAKTGQGGVWLVEGESGIGKSRLLNELRIHALVEGVEVFTGHALSSSGKPYQPWRDVLHRLALHINLTDEDIAKVKPIIPDVQSKSETVSKTMITTSEIGKQLPEFVAGLFRRYQQPALVLLDDLQWAGSESIAVLKWLIGSVSNLPLMVVGAYRSDERPDLLSRLPGTQVMTLHRLADEVIADLSVSILGESGRNPTLLNLLERESEGNIFFIVEILRALAEEAGQLSAVPTMLLPDRVFTDGIQSLAERRLARIPEGYQQLLELAAVSGRYLDTNVLLGLQKRGNGAELSVDQHNWLSTCAAAAILEVREDQWRFTHDKIREGIIEKLDELSLRTHHLHIAEAIEATYPNHTEFAAALAYHFGAAERLDKEFEYSEMAGQQADHSGAYHSAIRYHHRALDLLSPENRSKRAVITGKLGLEYSAVANFTQAEFWLQESLRLAREVNDHETIATALMRLGLLAYETGRSAEAGPYFEDALDLAIDIGDQKLLIRSLVELAHHEVMQEQFDAAERHITRALDASRSIEDVETLAFVNWGAGMIATLREAFPDAIDYFQHSRALYQSVDFLSGVLSTTNNLAVIFRLQGDYEQAWAYFQEVLEHRLAQGRRKNVASVMVNLGFTATRLGRHDDAHQYFTESYSIAMEIGAPTTALVALVGLAELKALAGDPITAIEVVSFALIHPATGADVSKDAKPILERISTDVKLDQIMAATERGQQLTLDTALALVLGNDQRQ
jgi:serine/threonine protein kinase/tetratricopeptide (TPR) repeat protein